MNDAHQTLLVDVQNESLEFHESLVDVKTIGLVQMACPTYVEKGRDISIGARVAANARSVTGGRTQCIQNGREESGVATGVHLNVSDLRRDRLGLGTQLQRPFHILQIQVPHFAGTVINERDAQTKHVQLQLRVEGVKETQHRAVTETALKVGHGNG